MRMFILGGLAGLALAGCQQPTELKGAANQSGAAKVVEALAGYDEALAARLGADDYGMASYVFVTLLTGPKDSEITDKEKRSELFAGHFSNMGRLAQEGKLVLAGPFMQAGESRGLFILDVKTIDEAKALVATDPAVAAGIFDVDYKLYYGSAALREINALHSQIQKVEM